MWFLYESRWNLHNGVPWRPPCSQATRNLNDVWVSIWVSRQAPNLGGAVWPSIPSTRPSLSMFWAPPPSGPSYPGALYSYGALTVLQPHLESLGLGGPLEGEGRGGPLPWNVSSDPGVALGLALGRRPPAPPPSPPPMAGSVFLEGLLILAVINSAFTLARAFGFAFAGMRAAKRTHEKLLGR